MILKKISPADLITLTNGLLGFLAILYLFDLGDTAHPTEKTAFTIATTLIFFAILADGLDGYVARRTQTKHQMGVYLDSMSDTVSFCFAPAILIYAIFYDVDRGTAFEDFQNFLGMMAASVVFLLGIIRLAQFSYLREDGLDFFEGMSTPAMTYFIIIFVMIFHDYPHFVLVVITALSTLMLSSFHYPKLRDRIALVAIVAIVSAIFSSLLQNHDSDLRYVPMAISFLLILTYFLYPVFEWVGKYGKKSTVE